jgi:aspartyl protease family protein
MGRGALALLGLVIAGALAWFFRDKLAGLSRDELIRLSYLALLAILVAGGGMAFRGGLSTGVRNILIWVLIFAGAMGVYVLRDDLQGLLNPSAPRASAAGIELTRADDGHFYADVEIDGAPLRMMVDTGATTVSLSQRDARAAGIDPAALNYVINVHTGAGEVRAAPAVLRRLRLGTIDLQNVEALVMDERLDGSVLGMSFLNRLEGYDVRGDRLILHPAP